MLSIFSELFDDLHDQEIRYCHFKSNDHLEDGLCGNTDLDILVHKDDASKIVRILLQNGFKRTVAGFGVRNHAREGYLGFDHHSGKLVYIDLHFTIIIGKNRIREYALDHWSHHFLAHRIKDENTGVFIVSPNHEFLLLLTRAAIKIRLRDTIRHYLGIEYFNSDWKKQYDWLQQRYDKNNNLECLQDFFFQSVSEKFLELYSKYPSFDQLRYLRKEFRRSHFGSLKYGRLSSFVGMFFKEANGALCFLNRKYLNYYLPLSRRTLATGGRFIALIGVDGAGKSTQIKLLSDFLSWKLDVSEFYLGAGDGSASWHRRCLKFARRLFEKQAKAGSHTQHMQNTDNRQGTIKSIAKILWGISLCIEKNRKLRSSHRQAKRDVIVISDRYPQHNVIGFNDGPLLNKYLGSDFYPLKLFSKWESKIYSGEIYGSPDLVIKLVVPPDVSIARGQSESLEYLDRRIKAVNSICFSNFCKTVTIDASSPIDEVAINIRRHVWEHL